MVLQQTLLHVNVHVDEVILLHALTDTGSSSPRFNELLPWAQIRFWQPKPAEILTPHPGPLPVEGRGGTTSATGEGWAFRRA